MNSHNTDIFLRNCYNLQSVHFEFCYIYIVSFSNFNLQKRSDSFLFDLYHIILKTPTIITN